MVMFSFGHINFIPDGPFSTYNDKYEVFIFQVLLRSNLFVREWRMNVDEYIYIYILRRNGKFGELAKRNGACFSSVNVVTQCDWLTELAWQGTGHRYEIGNVINLCFLIVCHLFSGFHGGSFFFLHLPTQKKHRGRASSNCLSIWISRTTQCLRTIPNGVIDVGLPRFFFILHSNQHGCLCIYIYIYSENTQWLG